MYTPTDYRSFHRVLRHIDVREQDVFLDYGSGLGRVLLMAAQYPFRRVLGVELSTQLNERARRNVACCRGKLCCRYIEVIQADATLFVPPSDVSVMYLYSPFGPTVLPKVLDNIHQSLEACPRELLVICKNPKYFEIEATRRNWLSKQSKPTGLFKHTYVIYRAALSEVRESPNEYRGSTNSSIGPAPENRHAAPKMTGPA
jgi:cyclopropane fatty-acyl-phospholipid synthase-like methyltransferase